MSLIWISKAVISRIEEKVMSLSVFYYCICDFPHCWYSFEPTLCNNHVMIIYLMFIHNNYYLTCCNLNRPLLMSPTWNEFTYCRKEQSGRSLRLTTRLLVKLFLQIWKFLMFLVSTRSKWVLSSTYIIMTLYLSLLIKSFKLEIRFINIQQATLTFTDLIAVEQISKNFWSCFKVLEYGIHYRVTSKTPRLLIYSSVWSNHF